MPVEHPLMIMGTAGSDVHWIDDAGRTAPGFGDVTGLQPCFTVFYNKCTISLRKSLVPDLDTAKEVFRQIFPVVDGIWPDCGSRLATITVRGVEWRVFLEFAFSFIDIRRKNPDGKDWL